MKTPMRVFPSPVAIGEGIAARVLDRVERERLTTGRFLLGCPTGRTPRPIFAAMTRQLENEPQDLSHVVLVLMDEYLVERDGRLVYAPSDEPWSCHHYALVEIAAKINAVLPPACRIRPDAIWFPDPVDPDAYDARIADAGGVDFFILASGASDGHVGFNPPGSPRESRTRIIPLSEETRRDNLQTFPAFGVLANVPRHGVSVGIDTIARAKEAVMVVWGEGKRVTLGRIRSAEHYESDWPATVIHECARAEVIGDEAAVPAAPLT
jgi:glucosamine-6-phosphate deaminase